VGRPLNASRAIYVPIPKVRLREDRGFFPPPGVRDFPSYRDALPVARVLFFSPLRSTTSLSSPQRRSLLIPRGGPLRDRMVWIAFFPRHFGRFSPLFLRQVSFFHVSDLPEETSSPTRRKCCLEGFGDLSSRASFRELLSRPDLLHPARGVPASSFPFLGRLRTCPL